MLGVAELLSRAPGFLQPNTTNNNKIGLRRAGPFLQKREEKCGSSTELLLYE